MKCLNRETLEYQVLKQVSGISGFKLDSCIRYYLDNFDRYPHLDEIPGADSSKSLSETLEIQNVEGINVLKINKLKEFTGVDNIDEAIPIINNKYRDIVVDITGLDDDIAIIKIKQRPSEYGYLNNVIQGNSENINSRTVVVKTLNRLKKFYGFNFKEITTDELSSNEWKNKVPEAHSVNAFIYNGEIYINTDVIDVNTAKMHELLHLFLGGMRYSDPKTYFSIVSSMEQLPQLPTISKSYSNRSHSDILEEVFVTEYSKYLTGQQSVIENLPKNILKELNYNICRNIDSAILGNYSVRSLEEFAIMNSTMAELSETLESDLCNSTYLQFVSAASVHRKIANTKEGLIKEGKLIENCI